MATYLTSKHSKWSCLWLLVECRWVATTNPILHFSLCVWMLLLNDVMGGRTFSAPSIYKWWSLTCPTFPHPVSVHDLTCTATGTADFYTACTLSALHFHPSSYVAFHVLCKSEPSWLPHGTIYVYGLELNESGVNLDFFIVYITS